MDKKKDSRLYNKNFILYNEFPIKQLYYINKNIQPNIHFVYKKEKIIC